MNINSKSHMTIEYTGKASAKTTEKAFEDDVEAYTAAALADKQEEEWEAVQEDWLTEARNAATFYEDNYAGVGL